MPTKREREYYSQGFADAMRMVEARKTGSAEGPAHFLAMRDLEREYTGIYDTTYKPRKKPRKLSAWQKFVKANSKKPRFRYKSGAKKGRVNLKALGVAYRKKRR
jgi:hypothetical protein